MSWSLPQGGYNDDRMEIRRMPQGKVRYKVVQFCSAVRAATDTMCFDLEINIAPEVYTFKFAWPVEENNTLSLWEAYVWSGPVAPNAPIGGVRSVAPTANQLSPVMTPLPSPEQASQVDALVREDDLDWTDGDPYDDDEEFVYSDQDDDQGGEEDENDEDENDTLDGDGELADPVPIAQHNGNRTESS